VQFCLIGLLVTLIAMLSFPSLGAIISKYHELTLEMAKLRTIVLTQK